MPRNSGALVVGFRKEDPRRNIHARAALERARQRASGLILPPGVVRMEDHELDASIIGGKCIGCNRDVYLNRLGMSAVREKDADVCCVECEQGYGADLTYSL